MSMRLSLLSGEMTMASAIVKPDTERGSVAAFLADLSEKQPIWGVGATRTVAHEQLWFMAQRIDAGRHRLICAACGDVQEELFFPAASCIATAVSLARLRTTTASRTSMNLWT